MTTRDPVGRALDVLVHIVESADGPTSARRLAAEMGLPTTTVHRALSSLSAFGLLSVQSPSQRYIPGPMLHRLARMVVAKHPLSDIVVPHLKQLSERTGETAQIGQYDASRREMMFIAQAQGSRPLRYVIPMHSWIPVYLGASGLAILAYLEPETRDLLIAKAHTEGGIDPGPLRAELDRIAEQGYSLTYGQRLPGAVGVAAPIRSADDEIVGDVALTVPEVQFDHARSDEYIRLVMDCAAAISTALGRPAPPGQNPFRTAAEDADATGSGDSANATGGPAPEGAAIGG